MEDRKTRFQENADKCFKMGAYSHLCYNLRSRGSEIVSRSYESQPRLLFDVTNLKWSGNTSKPNFQKNSLIQY